MRTANVCIPRRPIFCGAVGLDTPDASPDALAEHLRVAERWVECIQTHLAATANTVARGAYVETEGHCEAALKLI